jgi:hypothetical protein
MNFDDYAMKTAYPELSDFRVTKTVTFKDQTKKVLFDDKEAYQVACQEWTNERTMRRNMFVRDFFEQLGISDHPKRELLFEKAWEYGHASGYSDVMQWGYNLVNLIL